MTTDMTYGVGHIADLALLIAGADTPGGGISRPGPGVTLAGGG
jgi:hypothetical protein